MPVRTRSLRMALLCCLLLLPCLVSAGDNKTFTNSDLDEYSGKGGFNYSDNILHDFNSIKRRETTAKKTGQDSPAVPDVKSSGPVIGSVRGGCQIISVQNTGAGCRRNGSFRVCNIVTIQNNAGGRRLSGVINFKLSNGASDSVRFDGQVESGRTTKGEICLGADSSGKIPSVLYAECEFK